jgi:hypothetical protein
MDSVTAVLIVGVGLAVTLLVGIASQRRSRMALLAASRAAAPPPAPTLSPSREQQEDFDAVTRRIEEAREELLWLREQVARERARLERLRHQGPTTGAPPPAPPTGDSPWVVLGLRPGASLDDVRRRYRLLSRVWHPDRFTDGPPELRAEAEVMMARLNRAHQALAGGQAVSRPS